MQTDYKNLPQPVKYEELHREVMSTSVFFFYSSLLLSLIDWSIDDRMFPLRIMREYTNQSMNE